MLKNIADFVGWIAGNLSPLQNLTKNWNELRTANFFYNFLDFIFHYPKPNLKLQVSSLKLNSKSKHSNQKILNFELGLFPSLTMLALEKNDWRKLKFLCKMHYTYPKSVHHLYFVVGMERCRFKIWGSVFFVDWEVWSSVLEDEHWEVQGSVLDDEM